MSIREMLFPTVAAATFPIIPSSVSTMLSGKMFFSCPFSFFTMTANGKQAVCRHALQMCASEVLINFGFQIFVIREGGITNPTRRGQANLYSLFLSVILHRDVYNTEFPCRVGFLFQSWLFHQFCFSRYNIILKFVYLYN